MDPITLILAVLATSGVFTTATYLLFGTESKLDYDKRWQNDAYVAMIHETRRLEIENHGEAYTECECFKCKTPVLVPPKTPAGVSIITSGGMTITSGGITAQHVKPKPRSRDVHGGGWQFPISTDIPDGARMEIDQGYGAILTITWYTPEGQRMVFKSMSMSKSDLNINWTRDR